MVLILQVTTHAGRSLAVNMWWDIDANALAGVMNGTFDNNDDRGPTETFQRKPQWPLTIECPKVTKYSRDQEQIRLLDVFDPVAEERRQRKLFEEWVRSS